MLTTLGLIHFQTVLQSRNPFHARQCMASRRFGRHTLLDWMIGRLAEAQRLHQVAVLAPPDLAPRTLERIPPHVLIVPSPGEDAISDLLGACEMASADGLVLIGIECPFVDPTLTDELVIGGALAQADWAEFQPRHVATLPPGRGSSMRVRRSDELGIAGQWCTAGALRKLDTLLASPAERRWGAQAMVSRPRDFAITTLTLPAALDRPDLRLAIHNAEDWDHAHMIFEALGPDHLDWPRITRLLDQNPEIRQRMARLNDAEPFNKPHHFAERTGGDKVREEAVRVG